MLRLPPPKLTAGLLAAVLTVGAAAGPPAAALAPASVTGVLLERAERSPLARARLLAADEATGRIFPSSETAADGRFVLPELPPGTYALAVQAHDGLYVIEPPLKLGPGGAQALSIAVGAQTEGEPDDPDAYKPARPSVWNRPFTAALIVLGAAVVVGVIVDQATDDDDFEEPASPF
jgi:hypothetical protein